MTVKIHTLPELDRMLPLIRGIVEEIQAGLSDLRKELLALGYRDEVDFGDREILRDLPWHIRDRLDEVRDTVKELEELGLILRDAEDGLVEAYGERSGEIVFYSWRPGEERVRYWRDLAVPERTRRPVEVVAG